MENSNTKNSNTELKYQLTFDLGKRHEAHIENLGTFFSRQNGDTIENAHPYFEEEYKMTLAIIDYIVSHQAQNSHNTILISGSRGAGKTSFLHTIRAGLEKRNCNQDYGNNAPVNNNSFGNSAINNTSFYCLPEIDPSYFDENRNILKTVITLMFKQAKNRYMKKTGDCSDADFTELWKQFENVNKTLKCVDGKQTESYTLEGLNEYSDAADLREQMEHLVSAFLKICGDSNGFLVLLIDDLDMNVSYAAEMMEQIRKFLMIKKLIILISANLEQLQSEMREYYSKSFVTAKNTGLTIDIDDLATKYLLKMFPPKRRIFLDDAKQHLIETRLIIKGTSSSEATFENYNGENNQGLSLQKVLLSLLWDRTRLLFIPKKNQLHPLIPSNMRELFQFIAVLADMEPTDEPKDGKLFSNERDYEKIRRNIITFKNYIINIWVPTHLSEDERRLIHNMPKDIEEVNKYLVQAINKVGNKYKEEKTSKNPKIILENGEMEKMTQSYSMVSEDDPHFSTANKISNISNESSNVSYGDLMIMISKYEIYFEDSRERYFIDAVKIVYSILLFETLFFSEDSFFSNETKEEITNIQKLIAGTLYHPSYFELIHPLDSEKKQLEIINFGNGPCNLPHFYHTFVQTLIENRTNIPEGIVRHEIVRDIFINYLYKHTDLSNEVSRTLVENMYNAYWDDFMINKVEKGSSPNVFLEVILGTISKETFKEIFLEIFEDIPLGSFSRPNSTQKSTNNTKNNSKTTPIKDILTSISNKVTKATILSIAKKLDDEILHGIGQSILENNSYGISSILFSNNNLKTLTNLYDRSVQLDDFIEAICTRPKDTIIKVLEDTRADAFKKTAKMIPEKVPESVLNEIYGILLPKISKEDAKKIINWLPKVSINDIAKKHLKSFVLNTVENVKNNFMNNKNNANGMFIQYFGGKRPGRYDSVHIYDTYRKTDDNDITAQMQDIALDILAPLTNILNYEQFSKRASEKTKLPNTYDTWKEFNSCDSASFHNTFLPIYSIDYIFNILNNEVPLKTLDESVDATKPSLSIFQEDEILKNYYQKHLWEGITKKVLGRIKINDTITDTYQKIFNAGMEMVFSSNKSTN